jgi:predicted pyridoxine 5'-phosphate oxidase superfamily flavin-nucleotide-binding protein
MTGHDPFHDGERAVQERAGVRANARRIGGAIGAELGAPVAHFLRQRITLYAGSIAGDGSVWASQLTGPPGFVVAADERTVVVDGGIEPGDPLRAHLGVDAPLALLAIDLVTRRRVRVNGRVRARAGSTLSVRVEETFGNCPKYIQSREPVAVEPGASTAGVGGERLTDAHRRLIARADTFFLATAHPEIGADVSHRGGLPGFVVTPDDRTLVWGDYQGNMMFQSLGNLAVDPRAGLLFVDFEGATTLQLTGTATVDWSESRAARIPGAQRTIEFHLSRVVEHPCGNPIRWRLLEPSPHNPT